MVGVLEMVKHALQYFCFAHSASGSNKHIHLFCINIVYSSNIDDDKISFVSCPMYDLLQTMFYKTV